ncbi:hypothetical protein [Paraburkholderia sp. J63]|uniref:hypothetical protein n=1 Tax=Paraburkholderia sp. J63 TaxID=2805434 RepID=UPI002ABD543A|nr:hypothetical protein [Paraburkholderia sp. J63]
MRRGTVVAGMDRSATDLEGVERIITEGQSANHSARRVQHHVRFPQSGQFRSPLLVNPTKNYRKG